MPEKQQTRLSTREIKRRKAKEYQRNKAKLRFSSKNQTYKISSPLFDVRSELNEYSLPNVKVDTVAELRKSLSKSSEDSRAALASFAISDSTRTLAESANQLRGVQNLIQTTGDGVNNISNANALAQKISILDLTNKSLLASSELNKGISSSAANSLAAGNAANIAIVAQGSLATGAVLADSRAASNELNAKILAASNSTNNGVISAAATAVSNLDATTAAGIASRTANSEALDYQLAVMAVNQAMAEQTQHMANSAAIEGNLKEQLQLMTKQFADIAKDLDDNARQTFKDFIDKLTAAELKQIKDLEKSGIDLLAAVKKIEADKLAAVDAAGAALKQKGLNLSAGAQNGIAQVQLQLGNLAAAMSAAQMAVKAADFGNVQAAFGNLNSVLDKAKPGLKTLNIYICQVCGGQSGIIFKNRAGTLPNSGNGKISDPYEVCVCAGEHTNQVIDWSIKYDTEQHVETVYEKHGIYFGRLITDTTRTRYKGSGEVGSGGKMVACQAPHRLFPSTWATTYLKLVRLVPMANAALQLDQAKAAQICLSNEILNNTTNCS